MTDYTSQWPNWGDSGTKPSDGIDYQKGDNPKAQHFDYLWNQTRSTFQQVQDTLNAIDSDDNGIVDAADQLTTGGSNAVVYDSANDRDVFTVSEAGNVTIPTGNLTVSGDIDLNSTLTVGGSATLNSSLDVSGDTNLNSSLTVDGSLTASSQLTIGSDLTASAGTIWNDSSGYIEQSALQHDTVTINGGNALSAGTVSLGGSVTIDVDSNSIQTDELDLSISPTWTSEHTFDVGLTSEGHVEFTDSNIGNIYQNGSGVRQFSTQFHSGSGNYRIRDLVNGTDVFYAKKGGNVEIPNGSLDVSGGLTSGGDVDVDASKKINLGDSSETWVGPRKKVSDGSWENTSAMVRGKDHVYAVIDAENAGESWNQFYVKNGADDVLFDVGQDGNVSIPNGSLDVSGGLTSGGDVDVGGNEITNSARIKASGDNFGINTSGSGSGYFNIWDDSNGKNIFFVREGGNVEIPNGDLDVDRLSVLNWGSIRSHRGDGRLYLEVENDGGAVHLRNHNQNDILVGNSGGNVEIPNGSLDVSGGLTSEGSIDVGDNIRGGPDLFTDGSNINVWDTENVRYTLRAKEGGNVEIPNGTLDVSGGLTSGGDIDVGGNDINSVEGIILSNGTHIFGSFGSDENTSFTTYGNDIYIYDNTNNQDIAQFNEGGNVEISNGSLDVSGGLTSEGDIDVGGNHITSVRDIIIEDGSGDGSNWAISEGGATGILNIESDSDYVFQMLPNGNIEIPSGNLLLDGLDSSISDGDADRITFWSGNTQIRTEGNGSDYISLRDVSNGRDIMVALEGGNVEIPNGSLSIQGDTAATQSWVNNNSTAYSDSDAVDAVNSESSLSVDISGDADTLDGNDASAFASSGHDHDTLSGNLTVAGEMTENGSI